MEGSRFNTDIAGLVEQIRSLSKFYHITERYTLDILRAECLPATEPPGNLVGTFGLPEGEVAEFLNRSVDASDAVVEDACKRMKAALTPHLSHIYHSLGIVTYVVFASDPRRGTTRIPPHGKLVVVTPCGFEPAIGQMRAANAFSETLKGILIPPLLAFTQREALYP